MSQKDAWLVELQAALKQRATEEAALLQAAARVDAQPLSRERSVGGAASSAPAASELPSHPRLPLLPSPDTTSLEEEEGASCQAEHAEDAVVAEGEGEGRVGTTAPPLTAFDAKRAEEEMNTAEASARKQREESCCE